MIQINNKTINIKSISLEGVEMNDYPDFCDAYISYAEFNDGVELTETELETLTDDNLDLVNEIAHERLH